MMVYILCRPKNNQGVLHCPVTRVAHLILQVHLGPTGEEKLYHISVTTVTGPHEGSTAILGNRMRQKVRITYDEHWKVYTCCKVLIN